MVKYDLDGGFKAKIKSLVKNGYYSDAGIEIMMVEYYRTLEDNLLRYCSEVVKEVKEELSV